MNRKRGQSLVELAVCAPIAMLLALGGAAAVRVADGHAGLDAATQAAAAAAARSPDSFGATRAAEQRFFSVLGGYPVHSPVLRVTLGSFNRGDEVTATSSGWVDVGWASMLLMPSHVNLESKAIAHVESWRTHVNGS